MPVIGVGGLTTSNTTRDISTNAVPFDTKFIKTAPVVTGVTLVLLGTIVVAPNVIAYGPLKNIESIVPEGGTVAAAVNVTMPCAVN